MAKIIPIDVIKGISGKYGSGSNDYFATNSSSNKIRLAKLLNPYTGPATEKQLAQREKFAAMQAACSAWLNANRPGTANGDKGTELYRQALKLKRSYHLSNVNQVLFKYMDGEGNISLPDTTAPGDSTPGDSTSGDSTSGGTSSGGTSSGGSSSDGDDEGI